VFDDMPLAEIVLILRPFKTVSKGYASLIILQLECELQTVKVDILLNATIVDALSLMHVDNAYSIGKKMCES
jgi:GTP-binding protein LepA